MIVLVIFMSYFFWYQVVQGFLLLIKNMIYAKVGYSKKKYNETARYYICEGWIFKKKI